MPWTFAHPAAVLPLRSACPRWLSFPGLLVGSITPDVGYYFGQLSLAAFAHTLPGLIIFCVPVGLALLAVFTSFAGPLTVLLPSPHRSLVRSTLQEPKRTAAVLIATATLSILIGAATHVVWDSFTHANRWGVALVPILNWEVLLAGDRQIRFFNILQHASTALGLIAIAVLYWRAVGARREVPIQTTQLVQEKQRKHLLLACIVLSVLLGMLIASLLTSLTEPAYVSRVVVRAVVWSTVGFALMFVACSLTWWRWRGDA